MASPFLNGGGAVMAAGLLSLFITLLFCRWYYRRKLKNSALRFRQEIDEYKDIAWRSRMNPHFIHNSLNSINSFIHAKDQEHAAGYLTCFSRLMRKILEHSGESRITLAMELEALKDYIELELLRFGRHIDVQIKLDEQLDPEKIYVPPLFVQPFVENALLHGLRYRDSDGKVCIQLEKHRSLLRCCITDNGIGYPAAAQSAPKPPVKRSLGIEITRNRIALFNHGLKIDQPVRITNLMNGHHPGPGASLRETARGTQIEILLALVERG